MCICANLTSLFKNVFFWTWKSPARLVDVRGLPPFRNLCDPLGWLVARPLESRVTMVSELLMLCHHASPLEGRWRWGTASGSGEVERAVGLELQSVVQPLARRTAPRAPFPWREGGALLAERGHFEHPVSRSGVRIPGQRGAWADDRPQDEKVRGDVPDERGGTEAPSKRPALPIVEHRCEIQRAPAVADHCLVAAAGVLGIDPDLPAEQCIEEGGRVPPSADLGLPEVQPPFGG